jgi:cation transport ATPase
MLERGERCPTDAVIVAGQADVEPWFDATQRIRRQEGDMLLAGSRVLHGSLRAVVRWTGMDRAWARLTLDPERRADRHASPARLAERLCTSGALILAALAAVLALSARSGAVLALSSAAAAAATLCSVALPELIALQLTRGVYQLLGRGIAFRGPEALDQAARTTRVVFCAEGTLFADEPSVASIEPSGHVSNPELLALVSGAFASVASPLAGALGRCARAHQVRPDATRSPSHAAGLGVTAVASSGQSLVVGTRALLLGRRISVAAAETRIAELEGLGRHVLLAALDGRYVGLVAVQDGVASGGRAAVQRLLDTGVEPVLLAGAARDTCQALAHHLGLEHIRPEVLPEERHAELRRLADTSPALAVVGRASKDDVVLGAAPLSINVDGASGPLERWDIDVASGDVRDAAWAVYLARRLYADTMRSTLIAAVPALVALLCLLAGLPPWLAPLTGAMGTVLALRQSASSVS